VAAPSADNRHVFWLQVQGDMLTVSARPELQTAHIGRRTLGLISIGAVCENLMLRAGRLGVELGPIWEPCSASDPALVRFSCREGAIQDDPLERAIEQRQSNRRLLFRGPALSPGACDTMGSDAARIAGTQLVWLDAPPIRRQALQMVRAAEAARFSSETLHRELFDSIRFDVGWHGIATEGLSPASLELPWVERVGFSTLRHWRVQRVANLVGAHRMIGLLAADLPCRLAPHLCTITADGELDSAAIRAGRVLQRVWLRATALGVSFQVFGASALYALEGVPGVPAALQRRLTAGWHDLVGAQRPLLVFRMGLAPPPTAHCGRPEHESLLQAPAALAQLDG
jgi:hypothetical protein